MYYGIIMGESGYFCFILGISRSWISRHHPRKMTDLIKNLVYLKLYIYNLPIVTKSNLVDQL